MKVRIVGFQKTIGMPNFSNDRPLVVEADLEEGETMEEAWSKMNKAATDWHRSEYPHLYQEEKSWTPGADFPPHMKTEITFDPLPIISKDKEKIEIAIDNAETVEDLKALKAHYEFLPASLINHYTKRFQELTSGRPIDFTEGL